MTCHNHSIIRRACELRHVWLAAYAAGMNRSKKPKPKRASDDLAGMAVHADGQEEGAAMPSSPLVGPRTDRLAQPFAPSKGSARCAPALSGLSRLQTVSEAAELLSVSTKTIRRWIAAGRLPAVRLGRLVRVSSNSLIEFVQFNEDSRHE